MNIDSLQLNTAARSVPLESLAGNRSLSTSEKIGVASQQFEALLLKQILSETQKPVIQSEFSDDSAAAGIYRDMISTQLADSLSKSDAIGLARTFQRQLDRQAGTDAPTSAPGANAQAAQPDNPL